MSDRQPNDSHTSTASGPSQSTASPGAPATGPSTSPWPRIAALAGTISGALLLVGILTGGSAWSTTRPLPPEVTASQVPTGTEGDPPEFVGPPVASIPEPPPTARARTLMQHGPISGIVLGVFSQEPSYDYTTLLQEIRETGSPWVSLMVNNYQAKNDSNKVAIADARTPPLNRVRVTVRQARALGLRVLLFPILLLQSPEDEEWRGTIAPANRAEWFRSYRTMMNRYAQLAADEGVDLLSIGSEFNSMQGDASEWLEVIRQIREIYAGPITYSANWDSLEGVSFMSHLDLVGMTTYFGLSEKNDPSVATMVANWAPVQADVHEWKTFHGIPLLFTEVGYPSQDGANQNPWNYYHSTTVDLDEQRDCFDAFAQTWSGDTSLSGVFFYNWFGKGGATDTGYTPRGKPALKIIQKWFREHRPQPKKKADPGPVGEAPKPGGG